VQREKLSEADEGAKVAKLCGDTNYSVHAAEEEEYDADAAHLAQLGPEERAEFLAQRHADNAAGSLYVDEDEEEDEVMVPTFASEGEGTEHDEKEFDEKWKKWKSMGHKTDWKKEFPNELYEEQLQSDYKLDAMDDLIKLPMGQYYDKLEKTGEFGHFPRMARTYIGANLSEGFCERMISVANQVMTKGNTLLKDEHLKKLVVLRMNREFMEVRTSNPD